MANPSAAHEPSMEEILASIRQIISEDGEGQQAPEGELAPDDTAEAAAETSAEAAEDMTDETEDTAASDPFEPEADVAEAEPQPEFEPDPEPEGASAYGDFMAPQSSSAAEALTFEPAAASGEKQSAARDNNLLSSESDEAVHGAFSALAHTILAQNARTLEDLVAEMLQPMLKSWLDDNLPSLVERLVQEEIQRVSRGRP